MGLNSNLILEWSEWKKINEGILSGEGITYRIRTQSNIKINIDRPTLNSGVYRVVKGDDQLEGSMPPIDDWTGFLVIHDISVESKNEVPGSRVRQILYPDDINNFSPWTRVYDSRQAVVAATSTSIPEGGWSDWSMMGGDCFAGESVGSAKISNQIANYIGVNSIINNNKININSLQKPGVYRVGTNGYDDITSILSGTTYRVLDDDSDEEIARKRTHAQTIYQYILQHTQAFDVDEDGDFDIIDVRLIYNSLYGGMVNDTNLLAGTEYKNLSNTDKAAIITTIRNHIQSNDNIIYNADGFGVETNTSKMAFVRILYNYLNYLGNLETYKLEGDRPPIMNDTDMGYLTVFAIDNSSAESKVKKRIRQCYYPDDPNTGSPMTRTGSADLDQANTFGEITWSPWENMGGGLRRVVMTGNVDPAQFNVMYESFGNYTLTLPNPADTPVGTKICLEQYNGTGLVKCVIGSATYTQITDAVLDSNTDPVAAMTYMFECCLSSNGTDKEWVMDYEHNEARTLFDHSTKIEDLKNRIGRQVRHLYFKSTSNSPKQEIICNNAIDDYYDNNIDKFDIYVDITTQSGDSAKTLLQLPYVTDVNLAGAFVEATFINPSEEVIIVKVTELGGGSSYVDTELIIKPGNHTYRFTLVQKTSSSICWAIDVYKQ